MRQVHSLISLSQDCASLIHGLFSTRPSGTTEERRPYGAEKTDLL